MFREVYNSSKQRHRERLMANERLRDGIEKLVSIRKYFRFSSRAKTGKRDITRIKALRSVQQTLQGAAELKAKNRLVQELTRIADFSPAEILRDVLNSVDESVDKGD